MYAVVRTGGKQYRVQEGDILRVEKLPAEPGETITLDDVLFVAGDGADVRIGQPLVESAKVTAEVVSNGRGKKIRVYKIKRRKNYRRTIGHRQDYTELRIQSIQA